MWILLVSSILSSLADGIGQMSVVTRSHSSRAFSWVQLERGAAADRPSKVVTSPLFDAVPKRQCTRSEYDGRKVSNEDLKSPESVGSSQGVHLLLIIQPAKVERILEYVVWGNMAQMSDSPKETLRDRPFLEELKAWIRFGYDEVVSKGDGLFSGSTGNPVVPRWLGIKLFNVFVTLKRENDKYAKQIRSSAGTAVFVSE